MDKVRFFGGEQIPLEMHKVRIVQKLNLPPVEARLRAINEAGNNTFLLQNRDVFMDMLTDSGVNAMSDQQQAAMMTADDSYAGSATYTRMENKVREIFGTPWFLPAHQGRACENILAQVLVTPGWLASYGKEALRYGLVAMVGCCLLAVLCYLLSLRDYVRRVQGHPDT